MFGFECVGQNRGVFHSVKRLPEVLASAERATSGEVLDFASKEELNEFAVSRSIGLTVVHGLESGSLNQLQVELRVRCQQKHDQEMSLENRLIDDLSEASRLREYWVHRLRRCHDKLQEPLISSVERMRLEANKLKYERLSSRWEARAEDLLAELRM